VDDRELSNRPFWTLVAIRAAFWLGTALTLLWAPYPGVPPFRAWNGHTDLLFSTFAQWDSVWYLRIAERGYESEQSAAFFPLYPLAARAVGWVFGSALVGGVLVSLVAAGVAAVLLARLARPLLGVDGARDSVLYLALYPFAFVFTAVYAEGLFLALAVGAFLAGVQRRPLLAAGLGAAAVLTRPLGIALLPALVVLLWSRKRWLPVLLALPAALGAFALYLDSRLGDPGAFLNAQGAHWGRRTPTLGPLGGLWEAISAGYHGAAELLLHLPRGGNGFAGYAENDVLATRNVLHLLLLAAAIALTVVAWRRLGPAFGLYSAGVLVIVLNSPAERFPLVSLPRHLLADFPLLLALAAVTRERPQGRLAVLCGFAAVGAVAAVAFSRQIWTA